MELSPALQNCINDGDGNSNFAPLWIIFSVMCAPSSHKTLLCVTSQDHGEIFTDRTQMFVDRIYLQDCRLVCQFATDH
jgi:hypothetical protein